MEEEEKIFTGKPDKAPWLGPSRFQKGESGNPKGRPKGSKDGLRAILNRELEQGAYKSAINKMKELGVDIEGGTHADVIAAMLLWKAEQGNMKAIKLLFKYTEPPLKKVKESTMPERIKIPTRIVNPGDV